MIFKLSGEAISYLGNRENGVADKARMTGIVDIPKHNVLDWQPGRKAVVNWGEEIYIIEKVRQVIIETNDGVFVGLDLYDEWDVSSLDLKYYDLYHYPNKHLIK